MNPVPELLRRGADAAFGRGIDMRAVDDVADQLIAYQQFDPLGLGSHALTTTIDAAYEAGWQPLDLLHVVRRQQSAAVTTLAAAAILHDADLTRAATRAPEEWLRHLREIADAHPDAVSTGKPDPNFLATRLRVGGKSDYIAVNDQWIAVLSLLGQWQSLPHWPRIGSLPSQWPARRTAGVPTGDRRPTGSTDSKMLGRIRGLLAKADATEFEDEADTFTAKAQELMTKYSIDSLVLTEGRSDIVSRRIHVDNPHSAAKAQLLHVVATVNRVKTIWDQDFAVGTVVGSPVDVEQTEILFTSLLIQATRALSHSPKAKKRKGASSGAFGKAFLYSYAVRIGERLEEADAHVLEEASRETGDLLPMLAAQTVAVDAEFERLFPRVRTVRGPRLDAEGWESGHAAANDADLHRQR